MGTLEMQSVEHLFHAGWTVYGLARKPEALQALAAEEIIPVYGSIGNDSFFISLFAQQRTFDVIVSTTEDLPDFGSHFNDIMSMILEVAKSSNSLGVRPLLLFTSGCKDYGMTGRADAHNLSPHSEDSPLNPPASLQPRTDNAPRVFDYTGFFDAAILRPTTVFGRSGGYYGPFFELARHAKESNKPLCLPAHPTSILHGTHIDDCGDAYVKLAEHTRSHVAGQVFNISSRRYETLEEIVEALVKEYDIQSEVAYQPPDVEVGKVFDVVQVLTGFSQWVGSDKIRREIGWEDKRPLFAEGIRAYRLAYEAAAEAGHSNVVRVKGYMDALEQRH